MSALTQIIAIPYLQQIETAVLPENNSEGQISLINSNDSLTVNVQRLFHNTTSKAHHLSEMSGNVSDSVDAVSNRLFNEEQCKSIRRIVKPKLGRSIDDEWLFIVNDENHNQLVEFEDCVNTGIKCIPHRDDLAQSLGYTSECRQLIRHIELLALLSDGKIALRKFKMPGGCQCVLTRA